MYRHHLKRTRRRLLSMNKWKVRVIFWGSAISIGIAAALFALGSYSADNFYLQLHKNHPLFSYLLPPLGLALIAWLTRNFFKGTEGSGIPQAIAALSMSNDTLRSQVLSLKVAFGKIILTIMGLFSGASIGREGPTVHVGASIMYSLRHYLPSLRSHGMSRALILAGGAAGISAAFNTPLAGVIFAIEEMSRSFEERSSGTLLLAVILSGITALMILGEYSYFGRTDAALPLSTTWIAILVCGVLGGFFGGLFSTMLIQGTRRIAHFVLHYPVRVAFSCGLILSLLGFLSDGATFGTGYHEAKNLVTGGEAVSGFAVYKLLATVASYLSGIPGGIFAPSLSIGAGMGAEIAKFFSDVPLAPIVMLGMVGYFTGVVQTPITAFVIVMEMTNNSAMLMPLMVTALIAKAVSHLVCPQPIYEALAQAYLQKTTPKAELNQAVQ